MVEITLFEIHLDGARIDAEAEATANAPLSGLSSLLGRGSEESGESGSNPETTAETEIEVQGDGDGDGDTDDAGPSFVKLVLLTVTLAVVAALARRALGGEDASVVEDVADVDIAPIDVGE